MRAIVCEGPGGIEALRYGELPEPDLPPDGVRIAVRAAGVNFADLLLARGEYQEKPGYPFAPGLEAAGTVVETGRAANRVRRGDRVMAFLDHGGFAERAVAREADVVRIPDAMDLSVAGGFPVIYGTSHIALRYRAHLDPGEVLLVHGASGGVGLTAVEVGRAIGAIVIATASSEEKLAIAKDHGANHLVNYAREDVRERVMDLTGGADVVYDPVGGRAFADSLRCIRPGGRLLVIGFASGDVPQIPANHLLVKDAAALGLSLGKVRHHQPDIVRHSMSELMHWYEGGWLRPHISRRLPIEDAVEALRALQERRATGKIVLTLGESS